MFTVFPAQFRRGRGATGVVPPLLGTTEQSVHLWGRRRGPLGPIVQMPCLAFPFDEQHDSTLLRPKPVHRKRGVHQRTGYGGSSLHTLPSINTHSGDTDSQKHVPKGHHGCGHSGASGIEPTPVVRRMLLGSFFVSASPRRAQHSSEREWHGKPQASPHPDKAR